MRGSGRSISRSESSIQAVCTIASPSALTEDHLRRVTFPIVVRTRHQSTSGTPPRGESSQRFPGVFGPFAFRPDGKVLVGIADNWRRMVAVDLATGRVLWTTADLPGEPPRYSTIHFSPDGSTLLTDRDYGAIADLG